MPQAYVAYQMLRRGEDIAGLIERRTRQQIVLLVVGRYYGVLAREERLAALEADLAHAEDLHRQLTAFHREGLALISERERTATMAAALRQRLDTARRGLERARGELLAAMGLHPLATCELVPSPRLRVPVDELPELVLHALLHRPELAIADRGIAVTEDRALLALVSWLPNIAGLGSIDYTGNSMMRWGWNHTYGISAVLTVLDGFRSVNDYRRAKTERRAALVEREQQALAIVLGVHSARQQHQDATESHAVAARVAAVAERVHADTEARFREGLADTAERLQARAELIRARGAATAARYRREMATAMLIDAVGGDLERAVRPPQAGPAATKEHR